jgi:biofilm PGA synthesis N-glycosyltransferase PgaC
MTRRAWVTVALLVAASVGEVVYPAYLAVAGWCRGNPTGPEPPGPPPAWPAVTVVVPAFQEAGVISSKVADIQANGYPGPIEILVVADGDPVTAERAQAAGARVLCPPERLGKAQALNAGFEAATAPVVVITDANNHIAPGSIAALVCHFEDPTVGAVAGEKTEADGSGESLYWRFESWLKRREWRLGTTIGLVGELAAVRADAWRPIPPDVATDDLWTALDLSARGHRIAYEPRALAVDPPVGSLHQRWERRTRSVSGALYVFARKRHLLRPAEGLIAAEIWGHRLARYTLSPLAHLALVAMAISRAGTSRLARVFLLGHVLGAVSLTRRAVNQSAQIGVVPTALGQALFLQAVALGGLWRYLRGDRRTQWHRIERNEATAGG